MSLRLRGFGVVGVLGLSVAMMLGACGDDEGSTTASGGTGGTGATGGGGGGDTDALDRAIEAIGGEEALTGLTGLRVTNSGTSYIAGEGLGAGDASLPIGTYTNTVSYDPAASNWRVDYVRDNGFVMQQFTFSEIITNDVGYVSGIESLFGFPTGDMPSARLGSTTKTMRLLHPHVILSEVLATPSLASDGGQDMFNGQPHEIVLVDDAIAPIQLWVNTDNGLLSRLVTTENSHLYRDQELEVVYEDWMSFSGSLMFPETVTLNLGGEPVMSETRGDVEENPTFDADTFELPPEANPMAVAADITWGAESSQFHQEFAAVAIPLDFRQTFVMPTELAPGVFHLTGGTHHSLAVEQANGIVIVEAPLYPERGAAILDWVGTQFPGKSVTHVIATHHHLDHSAGLREFVAAGATVVMGAASVTEFEGIFEAPSTVQPDTLAGMANVNIDVEAVAQDGSYTLADATNSVEAQHITSVHSNDMLLIYVSNGTDTYVFESDLYTPGNGGAALNPAWAQELLDGINGSGFTVAQIVGGHGGVAPLSELTTFLMP